MPKSGRQALSRLMSRVAISKAAIRMKLAVQTVIARTSRSIGCEVFTACHQGAAKRKRLSGFLG
jgi:hypothetical protein